MKKRSIKNVRINAEVQRELGNIIRSEVKDPRISPLTTVVNAEVTPDLKYCKAYISVLGDVSGAAWRRASIFAIRRSLRLCSISRLHTA